MACCSLVSYLPCDPISTACALTCEHTAASDRWQCTARRYEYLLPTYALSPKEMPPLVSYRVTQEQLDKFQEVLSTKKMRDPSAKRHMLYFKVPPPSPSW
ncbi:hypothetical protein PTSG_07887 [Salpingoeca rosetta]|uniref:Uncharacterized protein n=1 Tax=Salpingoeca rosetta (strain ATCC 50818 / BSB-021) TaxID=946362 RepID=F2UGL8_SALR5|nr:uncharacterized protein PTSG_07887 [Salpingoeca rosetta]EGD75768.1 hypothetical protein PTSG_07887 [Salpingoeca rosetta]|eukprot:XP_004991689.1 hypothetical protein PTSG_07887 [Salpingoeca rosetta]